MTQQLPVDATVIVGSEPDFLQGGVTERRLRDEVQLYRSQVDALDHEFERKHIALDRVFITRITQIAADPFVSFNGTIGEEGATIQAQQ